MKRVMTSFSLLFPLVVVSLAVAAGKPAASQQKSSAPAAVAKAKNSDPTTGIEFIFVKGGCYQMGDVFGDGGENQRPVHEVCVADFNLGKYEVTQGQWKKVMGTNPAASFECNSPDCPVSFVSWEVAQEFIAKLNEKSSKKYRLPTEAEWEYAARSGGMKEKWAGTSNAAAAGEYAWLDSNANSTMHIVGQKKPNGLGLYDMSGNVMEWCQDWYDEGYYKVSLKDNPAGPEAGKKRVVRGGSFGSNTGRVTTTARNKDNPDVLDASNGIRLLLPAK